MLMETQPQYLQHFQYMRDRLNLDTGGAKMTEEKAMMTEEKAIRVLINVQAQFQASLDEVDIDKDCKEAAEDNEEIVNALEIAIKALKKS